MEEKILLIDDEISLLENLRDFFEDFDFSVATACNGEEGLKLVAEINPDIVIVDLNMPVMDGYEFTRSATRRYPALPIIVLSGVGMVDDAMMAIRDGAWDFLSKPLFDMQIILHTVKKCFERARLIKENKNHQLHLEDQVKQRTLELETAKKQIINCLGVAAEFKDMDTGRHVSRVAKMTYVIARGMGIDEKFSRTISDASTMHDIGKIGIDDSVLLKKGKLDPQEWDHMQQHVCLGYHILSSKDRICGERSCQHLCDFKSELIEGKAEDLMTVARRIALFHHERWDGKGYLLGLDHEDIPIEARIVSLVDFYDAISSKRPYKDPFSEDECRRLVREGVGTQFDPAVAAAFFTNLDAVHKIKYQLTDESGQVKNGKINPFLIGSR